MSECEKIRERLDDYADGVLPEVEREEVVEHLESCVSCCEEIEALKSLVAKAGQLPEGITPSRDLWNGIESQLKPTRSRPRIKVEWLAWGGSALLAAAAVLFIVFNPYLLRDIEQKEAPQDLSLSLAQEIAGVEKEHRQARQELLEFLKSSEEDIAPETLAVIHENLGIMDNALGDIRIALADDPENMHLFQMLVATQKHDLEFIDQVIALTTN